MNFSSAFNLSESGRSESTGPLQGRQSSADPARALPANTHNVTSDARMEKIANLRAAIQAGAYAVSPTAVADKIMQGLFDRNRQWGCNSTMCRGR